MHAELVDRGVVLRKCVDLDAQQAWLIRNGQLIRGPVAIASGGDGEETPAGDDFRVYRKDKDHKSQEFLVPNGQPAPMRDHVQVKQGSDDQGDDNGGDDNGDSGNGGSGDSGDDGGDSGDDGGN